MESITQQRQNLLQVRFYVYTVPQKHTKVEFKGKVKQASMFQDRRYMFKEESWELIFGVFLFSPVGQSSTSLKPSIVIS